MAQRLLITKLDRITLVSRSGRKSAKHPELRSGVVEVVKAEHVPATMEEALEMVLHGTLKRAGGPDVTGMDFDRALRYLLHH